LPSLFALCSSTSSAASLAFIFPFSSGSKTLSSSPFLLFFSPFAALLPAKLAPAFGPVPASSAPALGSGLPASASLLQSAFLALPSGFFASSLLSFLTSAPFAARPPAPAET
jgi:hypothetical protein